MAIERERIRAFGFTPEAFFEGGAELLGAVAQPIAEADLAERIGELCGADARVIHVRLHFAERDRRVGQRAVGVEDRILRILPPLLNQANRRTSGIFDEAVAVAIAVAVDPIKGALDVWPESPEKREISRAFVVGAGKHDEQRRRVDAAVVLPKRHFVKARHLAVARLVKNLSGLGVVRLIDAIGLPRSEVFQHPARNAWIDPQRLEGP